MVITILEATVAQDRGTDLERAYREAVAELPPDVVESFLTRDAAEPSLFRIMTVWDSREALDRMRASTPKPKGVQIFEAAGASPSLRILDVVVRRSR